MRRLVALAGLVLATGALTACGGPPDDASKGDFCRAFSAVPTVDKPSQDDFDKWVDELKDTGTPKNISDNEREGFEAYVDALDDTDVGDLNSDTQLEDLVRDTDELKDVEQLFVYYRTTCGARAAPGAASESDFCQAIEAAPTDDKPSQDDVDKWTEELKDTGTPDGIGDDERHGYEVLVDALDDVDVDDLGDDTKFEDVVKDAGDRKDVEAFFAYYGKTCAAG